MRQIIRLFALVLLAVLSGCAAQYHDYPPCGCVPYGYCPPQPLPYATYCGCPAPHVGQFSDAAFKTLAQDHVQVDLP